MDGIMQYPPGDSRMIDKIVHQLKSQGIFDQFRKECLADVDTKPAYQNLHQRVEGSVTGFLASQEWRPDLNKNQLRDSLRKHIHESGFLDIGVERIVDQVVNPKIMTVFMPQVEDVVYKFLGMEKPKKGKENQNVYVAPLTIENLAKKEERKLPTLTDLLPKELEPISPESDNLKGKEDNSMEDGEVGYADEKEEEDSSPPFEPIEEINSHVEESSMDSHLSGISELTSHDSQHSHALFNISGNTSITAPKQSLDLSNNDSQLSKVSSGSRLSIVSLGEQEYRVSHDTETNDESQQSKTSLRVVCQETQMSGGLESSKKDQVVKVEESHEEPGELSEDSNSSYNNLHIYTHDNSESDTIDKKEEKEIKIEPDCRKSEEDSEKKMYNEYWDTNEKIPYDQFNLTASTDTCINKSDSAAIENVDIKVENRDTSPVVLPQETNIDSTDESYEIKSEDIVEGRNGLQHEALCKNPNDAKPDETAVKLEESFEKKLEHKPDCKLDEAYAKRMDDRSDRKVEEKSERKGTEKLEKISDEKYEKKPTERKSEEKYERKMDEKKMEKKYDEKTERKSIDKSEKKQDDKSARKSDDRSARKMDEKFEKKSSEKKPDEKMDKKFDEKRSIEKPEKKFDEKAERKTEEKYDRKSEKKDDKHEKKHDRHREDRDKSKDKKSRDSKKTEHSSESDRRRSDKDKHQKERGDSRGRTEKIYKHDSKDTKTKPKYEEKSEKDTTKEKSKPDIKDSKDERKAEEKDRRVEKESGKERSKKEEMSEVSKYDKKVKSEDKKEKQKSDDRGRSKHDDKHRDRTKSESRDKSSRHDERNKDSSRSNSKDNKERSKQEVREKNKEIPTKSDEKKSKEKLKYDEKSTKTSEKGSLKRSDSKSSRSSDHKSKDSGKKSKDSKGKSVTDDHRIHREKHSEDRRSADRDSNGTAQDRSFGSTTSRTNGNESQPSQSRHEKTSSTSTSSKSDGGNSDSSCINNLSTELSMNMKEPPLSPSKSTSPPSSLPFKKRPLSLHSEDEHSDGEGTGESPKPSRGKIKKPKIAANIFEVKKIMMLRKSLAKKERKQQKEQQKVKSVGEGGKDVKSGKKFAKPVLAKRKKLGEVEKSLRKEVRTSLSHKQSPKVECEKEDLPELKYFEAEIIPNALSQADSQFLAYVKRLVENDNLSDISTPSDTGSEASEGDIVISLSDIDFDEIVAKELGATLKETAEGTEVLFEDSPDGTALNRRRSSVDSECGTMVDFNIIGDTVVRINVDSRPTSGMSNWSDKSDEDFSYGGSLKRRRQRSSSSNSNKSGDKAEQMFVAPSGGKSLDTNSKQRKRVYSRKKPKKDVEPNPEANSLPSNERRELRRTRKPSTRYSSKEFASYTDEDISCDGFPQEEVKSNNVQEQSYHDLRSDVVIVLHDVSKTNMGENKSPVSSSGNKLKSSRTKIPATITHNDEDSSDQEPMSESVGDGYDIIKENNNIDKGSSEDERGCGDGSMLNQDLILPTLRDLMVESGFRREDDKSDILPSLASIENCTSNEVQKQDGFSYGSSERTEGRRSKLGRSRRVGLSRPLPKSVSDQANNEVGVNRTATPPDYVMPLSPESDVSASSGEAKKALHDKVGDGNADPSASNSDKTAHMSNSRYGDPEIRRSLRSGGHGIPGGRGQRYNSDDLYKPRPLFSQGSRRVRGRVSPTVNEDVPKLHR